MDPFLIERWTTGTSPLPIVDEASVAVLREGARTLAASLGFGTTEAGSLAIVVSELAHNQLAHARDGRVALSAIEREGILGIEVVAADRGPGIADPTRALAGGRSTAGGLGAGLPGVLQLADEIDFDVRLGQGTCVRARKFARRAPRRREVAIVGRPHRDERKSGDDAEFVRTEGELLLALADGLGHGPEALAASSGAISMLRDEALSRGISPGTLIAAAGARIVGTRGAALTLVAIDEGQQCYQAAGVGNVAFHLLAPSQPRTFVGSASVLGARGTEPRVAHDRGALGAYDVVMLVSDGVSSGARIVDRGLLHRHPLLLAHRILHQFGRDTDDATVLVAC